jgi:hypothetical protein
MAVSADELRHPLCFLRGLWWSMRQGAPISGHNFVEIPSDPKEQVLKCETCGYRSVGYYS